MTPAHPTPAFTCSPEELTFLVGMLGGELVLGLPDPFWGRLAEEVEARWEDVSRLLLKKGLLERNPIGTVRVSAAAAPTLRPLCEAVAVCVFAIQDASGKTRYTSYHMGWSGITEQASTARELVLEPVVDGAHVLHNIVERVALPLEGEPTAVGNGGRLRREQLSRAANLLTEKGPAEAEACFVEAGLPTEVSKALAQTLLTRCVSGSLTGIARLGTEWDVSGVSFLVGRTGLWQARPTQTDDGMWLEIRGCTPDILRESFARVIRRTRMMVGLEVSF